MKPIWFIFSTIAAAMCAAAPLPQTAARAKSVAPAPVVQTRGERLAALTPDAPMRYFELAEEIAAEPLDVEDRDLARRLYVIALVRSVRGEPGKDVKPDQAPTWLAASACLALASLADGVSAESGGGGGSAEHERRWLNALAGTVAPPDVRLAVQRQYEASVVDGAALELASSLGSLRYGDGRRAAKLLERPAVAALLERYERLLSEGGVRGGAAHVRSLVAKFPGCPECRNKRYVKDKDGVRLCPSCGGRPGPKLDGEELVGQLRLESLLLNGIQRSWAAQVVADEGAPLRELDVESVADAYGVDPAKVWWRNGRWAADSAGRPDPTQPDTAKP